MKKLFLLGSIFLATATALYAQSNATIKEYRKVFTTYPFSDPDPIPNPAAKIYPYFRFDGYTDKSVQKEWDIVELENDYIKVMILPEVGGKVLTAIEKSTGKSFIYYNHVIKFRDVAMRGPWTSGGIEANYGIIGHTPNCATPVDYTTIKKPDGSVSCVIGVLDLLTRTSWRVEINLAKDKAYFTTASFWYNSTNMEQPYYTWMNAGIKAAGKLQFIYPGTHYLGHEGEYSDWPINKQNGKDLSFYDQNNFGGYKSYHVFGKSTDFFGGYWHNEDFGMARYSTYDDKAGKKLWIWGLSQQGMIWEKLLTDTDGQYVELQSGRLFNQTADKSTFTPFKHKGFAPYQSDSWKEYWFPVLKTQGFLEANNYGSLNVKNDNGWLKIYFSPLQKIDDELTIKEGEKQVYKKTIHCNPLQLFKDSIRLDQVIGNIVVTLGNNKLVYDSNPNKGVISRPLTMPENFDWNTAYGLYLQGKENIREQYYINAVQKLDSSLQKDPNFIPALGDMAMLRFRNMEYAKALACTQKALSIDTYDPKANFYYGLTSGHLQRFADAKDGLSIAAMDPSYRVAAYTELSKLYLKEKDNAKASEFALKSLDFNKHNIDALQILAVIFRQQNNRTQATEMLDMLLIIDPLNHFARYEKYNWDKTEENKKQFISLIRNEMPEQTYMELAIWYASIGCRVEASNVLKLSPQHPEVLYWLAYLANSATEASGYLELAHKQNPLASFPFRQETAEVLEWAKERDNDWKLNYYLGLVYWHYNQIDKAQGFFRQCGEQPNFAPFYAARFTLCQKDAVDLSDLQHAIALDKKEWRYQKILANNYISNGQSQKAEAVAAAFYSKNPENYIMGMLYAKSLLLNKHFAEGASLLNKIHIIPYEGSIEGRSLYKEAHLMLALEHMQKSRFAQALKEIELAKQWPDNLGAGKPYNDEIDERLEDWLTYDCSIRLKDGVKSNESLKKIILFTPKAKSSTVNYIRENHLISAWALQKTGQTAELASLTDNYIIPNDSIGRWMLSILNKNVGSERPLSEGNENYRIIQAYLKIREGLNNYPAIKP